MGPLACSTFFVIKLALGRIPAIDDLLFAGTSVRSGSLGCARNFLGPGRVGCVFYRINFHLNLLHRGDRGVGAAGLGEY